MQGTLWQNHFDYARIAWKKMLKDSKNEFAYDDVLAKFDIWGGVRGASLSTIGLMIRLCGILGRPKLA